MIKTFKDSIFLLFLFPVMLFGQTVGDTLYVVLKNGLLIYANPNSNGKPLDSIGFNEYVVLLDREEKDTLEKRIDSWWRISTKDNKYGYVFGGFLNKIRITIDRFASISDVVQYLLQFYPVGYTITSSDTTGTDQNNRKVTFIGSLKHSSITENWEGGISLHQFDDMNVNELLNIISLIDLGGEGYEYKQMMDSGLPQNGYRFEWENEYDDGVRKVVLEKKIHSGVMITMRGR